MPPTAVRGTMSSGPEVWGMPSGSKSEEARSGDQNPRKYNRPLIIFFVVIPGIVKIRRSTVVHGTHNSVNHAREWYVAMGVGEMGCNVPSKVVGFDDGFQPEAIVWANPTRLGRAQNPHNAGRSVYKTFLKSPRRPSVLSQATTVLMLSAITISRYWPPRGGEILHRRAIDSISDTHYHRRAGSYAAVVGTVMISTTHMISSTVGPDWAIAL